MKPADMSFEEFARLVIDAVEAARVKYMIGGSVGLLAWGEPRTTRDIDLVVNLPLEQVYALSQELNQRDMLVPWEIILDLLQQSEGDLPINAIHLYTGFKAELFLLRPGDNFRAAALARRLVVDIGPPVGNVYVQSPEDLIIYKLRYFQISEQPKHLRDIQSILVALRDELEYSYIDQWVRHFSLVSLWEQIRMDTGSG
jgi:hypothetical protein